MASTKEYLNYILDQLSGLKEISYKLMMGEYIIYYQGKIVGRHLRRPLSCKTDGIGNTLVAECYVSSAV